MPGQRPLLAMGFVASVGITFEVLACLTKDGDKANNFWPLLILIFYILLPIPIMISKRASKDWGFGMNSDPSGNPRDLALFLTAGIMVSSMALPIVMARSPLEKPLISPTSCALVEMGNILCHATILLFYVYFKPLNAP